MLLTMQYRPVVYVHVFVMCCLAAGALAAGDWSLVSQGPDIWKLAGALIGLGLLAEVFSTPIGIRKSTASVVYVPALAAVVLLGPAMAAVVAGVVAFLAETVIRRKALIRVVHNTAKAVTAVTVAGMLYVSLGAVPSTSEMTLNLLPFIASSIGYFVVSNGAAATAISLEGGLPVSESWGRAVFQSLPFDMFASSLSLLLAFFYVDLGLPGIVLVIVPLFFVRHANHVNLRLEQGNRDLLDLMVKAIEARDPYTSGHSRRVAELARTLAREIGLGFREVEDIGTAALLHDVGKIYEEFAPLLRKESKLTKHEQFVMESHPARSAELVGTISSLRGYIERSVRYHHENYDGTGYPTGLRGEEIPLGARIVMIADTADAMTTDRPYRRALSYERVVAELRRYEGKQFDPDLVDAFCDSSIMRAMVASKGHMEAPIEKAQRSPWRLRLAK